MSSEHSSPCAGCANAPHGSSASSPFGAEIGRRQFLSAAALAAVSAMLAACGASDALAPALTSAVTVNVSTYPALGSVGGVALVTLQGSPFAIVRTGTSSFLALSRICPHQGSTVNTVSGGGFLCPNHGARFDANGNWIGGQPTSNMHSYTTAYDATTGVITVS